MNYKAKDYSWMARQRRTALIRIAEILGKEHKVTKLMGNCAYGRSNFEHGPETNLQIEVRWMAGLDGIVQVLKTWCNLHGDKETLKVICDNYPVGYDFHP